MPTLPACVHAGPWKYWSTDGLGLFEYMLLAEELNTEPVWVINNGVAHFESEWATEGGFAPCIAVVGCCSTIDTNTALPPAWFRKPFTHCISPCF